jgi:hypothetical protein
MSVLRNLAIVVDDPVLRSLTFARLTRLPRHPVAKWREATKALLGTVRLTTRHRACKSSRRRGRNGRSPSRCGIIGVDSDPANRPAFYPRALRPIIVVALFCRLSIAVCGFSLRR